MPLGTDVDLSGLSPGHILLDAARFPLPERGTASPPFRPMFIMAKRSPISATAELVFYFVLVPCGRLSWPPVSFWAGVNVSNRVAPTAAPVDATLKIARRSLRGCIPGAYPRGIKTYPQNRQNWT